MDKLKTIIEGLESNIDSSDFPSCCETAVAEIKRLNLSIGAIEPLLSFMTKYPDLDYGMPGALIHFIESFPEAAYIDFLIRCIQKQPTEHNVWMLLRIMNTWESSRQDEYIGIMKTALLHPNINEGVKESIKEYLQDFEE